MPITTIANMQIVPDKFSQYVIERTTEKSTLVRSGITISDPVVGELISGTNPEGGACIQMPFYKPLEGEAQVFGEDDVEISDIQTGKEYATLHIRQHAWGDTDLSRVLGGNDPMAAVGNLLSDWWVMQEQKMMLSILKGIAKDALQCHVLDISTETGTNAIIDVDNTLDAKNLMGDACDKLGIVFMHSATFTRLQKQQKIESEYDSDLKIKIDYYLGYKIIVDDGMPVNTGIYDTYFIGKGCISRNDGVPRGLITTEKDRDKLGAKNYLINRRALVLHPIGISWNPNAALSDNKSYPSNADLEVSDNWFLVKDHKNIPIVILKHKIA